jgi:hypothetical protein
MYGDVDIEILKAQIPLPEGWVTEGALGYNHGARNVTPS